MPTYDFRCPAGHEFERFYKISEAPQEMACPECGEAAARKISGGAGLLFKGTGFYITDYGKDGKKDQRQAAQKAEGGSKGGEKGGDKGGSGSSGGSSSAGSSGSSGSSGSGGSSSGGAGA